MSTRREAILVTLAAAEVCWAAVFFLGLNQTTNRHQPLLLWLAMLILLLGYSYFYRALVEANLSPRFQQAISVGALALSIALMLRYHVYADIDLHGAEWWGYVLRHLLDITEFVPDAMLAILVLIYFWARGMHLARRSLSVSSVGFSFRSGVVIFIVFCLLIALATDQDPTPFIIPYFFFALVAVALARIEEVSHLPGGSRAPFSSFWIGSTLAAVGMLVLAGMGVAVFFYGGGLETVLVWLSPLLFVLQVLLLVVLTVLFAVLEFLISLIPMNWANLGELLEDLLSRLQVVADGLQPSAANTEGNPALFRALHAGTVVAVIIGLIALVVVITWVRSRRAGSEAQEDEHESLFSAQALAESLLNLLKSGRQRLGELAGLASRFGLSAAFLSAVSIRRIYANLIRLANEAGYPRAAAQTPYEFLDILVWALPGSEEEVRLITDAYVNAHYGKLPDTPEGLQRIRQAWERVRERHGRKPHQPD